MNRDEAEYGLNTAKEEVYENKWFMCVHLFIFAVIAVRRKNVYLRKLEMLIACKRLSPQTVNL